MTYILGRITRINRINRINKPFFDIPKTGFQISEPGFPGSNSRKNPFSTEFLASKFEIFDDVSIHLIPDFYPSLIENRIF